MHDENVPPDSIAVRFQHAYGLLRGGKTGDAVRMADDLLHENSTSLEARVLASDAYLAADDAETALEHIEAAIALAPTDIQLLRRQAQVFMALMRRRDARGVADRIAGIGTGSPQALWVAARIYNQCDDPGGAALYLEQALAAGGRDPRILNDLAAAQFFLGDFEKAEQNLDDALGRTGSSGGGQTLYLRSTLRKQTIERNHIAELEARLRSGLKRADDAAGCLYALAKELEDLERWADALSALKQGARVKRASLNYEVSGEVEALDGMARVYDSSVMEGRDPSAPTDRAIFIVGMPRTGTTLVERILGRHPEAESLGELPYFAGALATATGRRMREQGAGSSLEASLGIDFAQLGRSYLDGARQAATADGITVNKMPVNFLYCGLIKKALPNARIVHLVRDPMDTCFAVYKTLFKQAYYFSYDFAELAAYYAAYRRLMQHWHAVMPGEILDIRYEDLVTDTDGQARRLLDWCGLPWNPVVLSVEDDRKPSTTASAAQVRGAVHSTSVGKWRRFGEGLSPLRRALQEQGVQV
jgi:tetratricopeptide (TPR) repeat protein